MRAAAGELGRENILGKAISDDRTTAKINGVLEYPGDYRIAPAIHSDSVGDIVNCSWIWGAKRIGPLISSVGCVFGHKDVVAGPARDPAAAEVSRTGKYPATTTLLLPSTATP